MNTKIIIGWVLLAVGLAVIGTTINSSYRYFNAQAEFPAIFKSSPAGPAAVENKNAPDLDLQAQMQESINLATQQAIADMLPTDAINKMLNAVCWSIFAAFMVYAGFKIAEIGVKMLS